MMAIADRAKYIRSWELSNETGLAILKNRHFIYDWCEFKERTKELMTKLSFVTDSFFFRLPLVGTKIESREGLKLANELDLEMKFRIKDDKNGNTSFREIRLSPQNGISNFPHFLVKSFRILSVRAYERPR